MLDLQLVWFSVRLLLKIRSCKFADKDQSEYFRNALKKVKDAIKSMLYASKNSMMTVIDYYLLKNLR